MVCGALGRSSLGFVRNCSLVILSCFFAISKYAQRDVRKFDFNDYVTCFWYTPETYVRDTTEDTFHLSIYGFHITHN